MILLCLMQNYSINNSFLSTLVLAFIAQLIASCGSSGGDLQGKYSVTDVNILADDIEVGESVRAEVFFETKFESNGSPDGVEIIVRIPPELEYIAGTSFIYDNTDDNADPISPDDIRLCASGEAFLIYDFADFELSGREIGNPGQFGLKFEARGVSSTPLTLVGATAGRGDGFACGEEFSAEENEGVQVL